MRPARSSTSPTTPIRHSAARSARAGAQEFAAFGWDPADVPDPQDPQTFARSKLDWDEQSGGWHADLLAWYRRLIALRREVAALSDPRLDQGSVGCDEQDGWLVVRRGQITVACNLGAVAWTFPAQPGTTLLAVSEPSVRQAPGGVELPPDAVAILAEQVPAEPVLAEQVLGEHEGVNGR